MQILGGQDQTGMWGTVHASSDKPGTKWGGTVEKLEEIDEISLIDDNFNIQLFLP